MHRKILIIADIEGSTGCPDYEASRFNTEGWYSACIDMSLDINEVVCGLFNAGAEEIYVKDFHRTGYNLLPELIDRRVKIIHGYKAGPVPGIGDVYDAEAVMFIGMHASSGSGGFLAHTLTSRYSNILVNERKVSELQLFASSLYGYSLVPIFFSGCNIACCEAEADIPGIEVFSIVKDRSGYTDKAACRKNLAQAAAASLDNHSVSPYCMNPPFDAVLEMRDGAAIAEKTSKRWGLECKGDRMYFKASDFEEFYRMLIRVTYFVPAIERIVPAALLMFNLYGRAGLAIVRYKKNAQIRKLI